MAATISSLLGNPHQSDLVGELRFILAPSMRNRAQLRSGADRVGTNKFGGSAVWNVQNSAECQHVEQQPDENVSSSFNGIWLSLNRRPDCEKQDVFFALTTARECGRAGRCRQRSHRMMPGLETSATFRRR
jgi:hypothetical protein